MKMLRTILLVSFCILAVAMRAPADSGDPVLTLDPTSGALTGPAGSTVGWGFTLTSGGSDFAVISGSDFCVGPVTSPCSNSFGTYTDFAGPQFIVVGNNPGESPVTETFDNSMQTGMGSFAINAASTGTISGDIVVTYDLYSVDPNSSDFDPEVDTFSNGDMLFAPASVTVGSSSNNTVPEPATLPLLLAGFAALVLAGLKSGKNLRTNS
jgi:hypothetical protein